MPAIIKRIEKVEKANLSVRIPVALEALLKEYARAKNRSTSEITAIALDYVITGDAEFMRVSGHAQLSTAEAVQKPPKKAKTASQAG